jgi:MFS family permease
MNPNASRAHKVKSVIRVASGNFLEAYDFIVFGYYAAAIGATFFPSKSDSAPLMYSFMTFGAGFLMRPLGAMVLGGYMDRKGRRTGLLLALTLMAIGTITIAATPGYAKLGIVAPIVVVAGRLMQGLSAGAESGGVSVYLSEIANPEHRGFYVSWQSASNQVAVIFAALLGILVSTLLPPQQMTDWGWRIPLIVGCSLIPLIFAMRASLEETGAFLARKDHPTFKQIGRSLASNARLVLSGTMLGAMMSITFYMITVYTPTYGNTMLKLRSADSMTVTLCVGISNFLLLPVMGALSDHFGRRPQLLFFAVLGLFTAYPVLAWLVAAPSFTRLLSVELWLSLIYSGYNGAMVVYLTEIMPTEVRTSGFSIAYSLATALFGGFTPAICTYLIKQTGNKAIPGIWLSFAAIVSLSGLALLRPRKSGNSLLEPCAVPIDWAERRQR